MACNWAERKGAVRGATVLMLLTAVGLAGCDRFGGDKASTVPTPAPAPNSAQSAGGFELK